MHLLNLSMIVICGFLACFILFCFPFTLITQVIGGALVAWAGLWVGLDLELDDEKARLQDEFEETCIRR
jgi:hypothetical protein